MYNQLKKIIIIASFIVVTALSVVNMYQNVLYFHPGTKYIINIDQSTSDVKEQLEKLAQENDVTLAKLIHVGDQDNTSSTTVGNIPTYQKIGPGELPKNIKIQTDNQFLENSSNDVLYLTFTKDIEPLERIVDELNNGGNTADLYKPHQILGGIIDPLATPGVFSGYILLLISFMALIVAENVKKIKKVGVKRLSGYSKRRISYEGLASTLLFIIGIGTISFLIGLLILFSLSLNALLYIQILLTTILIWSLILIVIYFFFSILVLNILQLGSLANIIKNKVPLKPLMFLVFFIQIISIICLLTSASSLVTVQSDIGNLSKAKKYWANSQDYTAPSTMIGSQINTEEEEQAFITDFSNFIQENEQTNNLMLVADNFSKTYRTNVYSPGNEANVLIATSNYLTQVPIDISSEDLTILNNMKDQTYGILIPKSQENNRKTLENGWSNYFNGFYQNENASDLSYISIVYDSTEPLFTYRVRPKEYGSVQSFADSPVIIIINSDTFKDKSILTSFFMQYISNEQVLFSDKAALSESIKAHNLQSTLGTFYGGKQSVLLEIQSAKKSLIFMILTFIIAFICTLFLIILLAKIYLYQNRKKFFIMSMAGYTTKQIHKKYLTIMIITTLCPLILFLFFSLSIYVAIIPFIFIGIILFQFNREEKTIRTNNLDSLKG